MYLRPCREDDARQVLSWMADDEGAFYAWTVGRLGEFPMQEADIKAFAKGELGEDGDIPMVACIDDLLVGYIVIRLSGTKQRKAVLDYGVINPETFGNGYGRRMIHLALHYAFEVLCVKKVTTFMVDTNRQSIDSYLNCGFCEVKLDAPRVYSLNGRKWTCKEYETYSIEGSAVTGAFSKNEDRAIKEIIDTNNFRYAFQPIVSAQSGEIIGYEALMRAESNGPISPLAVLSYAERTNRIYDIEKATFGNVLRIVSERISEFGNRKIFVNSLPKAQLTDGDYHALWDEYSQYFRQLTVEITESTELTDGGLEKMIEHSKDAGFGIAIDDYGTGYSNTGNLLRYSPNCVKIDRLLISDIQQDNKKQHFVKSIVEFAKANGFQTLAEGVETSAELHTVIAIGVDLIQGYYTAKPSFDILQELPSEIQNEIINANVRGQTMADRKVYQVTEGSELPLMRVALEKNTGILIAQENYTIVGNPNYVAAMNVKIKDGMKCRLVIRDVFLESFQDMPCIELGENVELTLVLEGQNSLRKVGIYVPATSSLQVEGDGNLHIHVLNIQSFGIGNRSDSLVGDITWRSRGFLDILVEADDAIAIGGGQFAGRKGIDLVGGKVRIAVASERAIGIGCVKGDFPINISNIDLNMEMNVENGIGIGCRNDKTNVRISVSHIVICGSGSILSGIGSTGGRGVNIDISSSSVLITVNGKNAFIIGTEDGIADINLNNSNVELRGEGIKIMGIGSRKGEGSIHAERTNCTVTIRSGEYMLFGADEDKVEFIGGTQKFDVNA